MTTETAPSDRQVNRREHDKDKRAKRVTLDEYLASNTLQYTTTTISTTAKDSNFLVIYE